MARFANRPLQWSDVIGRFEAKSSAEHARNALGLVGRLKDEGRKFWDADSKELEKWRQYCDVMWTFLNSLRKRRDVDEQVAVAGEHRMDSRCDAGLVCAVLVREDPGGVGGPSTPVRITGHVRGAHETGHT